jgi:NADH dehydrogenase
MTTEARPRVVIVGAGFGGLWAGRALADTPVEVLLLDRNNYHTFLPLLYQVAAAELEPEDIAQPVRSLLHRTPNAAFMLAGVQGIDFAARQVQTTERAIPYDFLILAVGSTSHYFGVPGAAEHAFPLRTLEQGIALRNQILCCFERAMHETNVQRRQRLLTFVIVGGGPTGVEFAGSLIELVRGPLARDYPALDFQEVRVVLLEAADRLLSALPERLSAYAMVRLRKMGVQVMLGAKVSQVAADAVRLGADAFIPTETVVWTAGMRGATLADPWGLPTARNGQVLTLPTLQTPDHPEVYIVGDLACVEQDGHPLPMVAPVATQQGEWVARNIVRQVAGKPPLPFHYHDRGTMVTIGRNSAVTCLGGRVFTGFPAWMLWLGVHIANLIGFRNRLLVLINWAWDYLFYERAVQLILPLKHIQEEAQTIVSEAPAASPQRPGLPSEPKREDKP